MYGVNFVENGNVKFVFTASSDIVKMDIYLFT